MTTTILKVTGMTCGHCVRAVTDALESQNGVTRAEVDLVTGRARVEHDESKVTAAGLASAVMDEGYSAEEIPAPRTTEVRERTAE